MKTKELCTYLNNYTFCVLIPVYYECERRPSWRKYFIGTKEEAKEAYKTAPEYITATNAENKEMRGYRLKEYLFLREIGHNKEADDINSMYHFTEV